MASNGPSSNVGPCADRSSKVNVLVKDAEKSYRSSNGKKHLVFSHVNLTLPQGTVYGLLGPSGCGKTSLIRCILGRLDLDEGSVSVFGHCPGTPASGVPGPHVGYMPQETCIPKTLTIAQCWTYFATILGMSKKQISDAISYFIQLLNLPPANTPNSQLSGGELRRVAFATALIHEPKLLILDEPTVGIDCITKKNMWEHLLKLANEKNTSIILTTHYIEEARAAHKVGLMQSNTLVVEDYTENLLRRFSCESLEDVFLKICSNADPNVDFDKQVQPESTDVWIPMNRIKPAKIQSLAKDDVTDGVRQDSRKKKHKGRGKSLSWRDFHVRSFVLKAVILKNWLHLYRFPGMLIFVMLFPCVQVSGSIFSFKEVVGRAQMALVNYDSGVLGERYLAFLNDDMIHLQSFQSDSSAMEALRGGRVRGVIIIRQNFSDAQLDRIINSPLVRTGFLNGTISITLDVNDAHSKYLGLHMMNAYERFLYETYNETGLNYLLARPIIFFERKVVEYISVPRNMAESVSILSLGTFFSPAAVAVLSLIMEINSGHLERSVVAGVTTAEILLGLLVVLMACGVVQLTLELVAAFFLTLHALSWGTFFLTFLVLYFHGMCGMAFGILLSVVCSQTYVLLVVAGYVVMFCAPISGGFWPLSSVHYIPRGIYLALPQALQLNAVIAIYLGTGIYVTKTLCSLASSLAYTLAFLGLSMVLLRKKT